MLGSAGNRVQAGIDFTAKLDALKRTERRLNSLKRDVDILTGGMLGLSEGSDSASRSFVRFTGSTGSASAGLGALQTQIVSTTAAQKTLEDQTGGLREEVGTLNNAIRNLADEPDDWAVGDALNEKQRKVIEAAALELDDVKFNPGDLSDDGSLKIGDDVINSIEDYNKVVQRVTGTGDGFTDDDRFVGLPDIEPTKQYIQELEKIDSQTDEFSKSGIWEGLFRPIGADETPAPADTTDTMFPQSTEFDKHIFHDIFESGDFTDVNQLAEGIKSGDVDLQELLSVGPSMSGDKDATIYDLFPGGAIPKGRTQRELFEGLPGDIQEDMRDSLKDAGITNIDDIFTTDDVDLNNAFLESIGDQGYTFNADEVREMALEDLRKAYPVPESDSFYNDLAKDIDNIGIPLGELGESRKIDAQSRILQGRQDRFQSADDVPAGFMRAVSESENLQEHLDLQGLESVSDIADAEIGILNRLPGFGPERSEKLRSHAQQLQTSFNSFDENLTAGLIGLMSENEEIMDAVLESSSFEEAYDAIGDIDEDGLARLDMILGEQRNNILENNLSPEKVLRQLDTTNDRADLHRQLRQTEGIGEVLNDRQIEMLTGIMADLGGDSDDIVTPQKATRENLGFRTLQELMDTDPSEEPDRARSLQGIMRSVFDPGTGVSATMFDDPDAMQTEFYNDMSRALPSDLTTPGGFGKGEGPDLAEDITKTLMGTDDGVGIADFFGEDSMSIGQVLSGKDSHIDRFAFDEPELFDIATSETEKLLSEMSNLHASRVAGGMQYSTRRTDGITGPQDLLPGSEILQFDTEQDNASRKLDNLFNSYFDSLDGSMNQLRQTQQSSPILQGGAGSGFMSKLFGNRERPRGIFGTLGTRIAETEYLGSPRRFREIQDAMDGLIESYDGMLPTLEATSLRLGSVNVNFESMGIMLFKLTAMIGPLVAGLVGLATAAAASAAALGGLVAVGAVEYLGEMEKTMAGINNKQEAMAELGDVLTDMAWEAVMPLRDARIGGDGMRGYEAFISLLRGGLTILNRVANILAYVVELEVVGEELDRITSFLMDPGGDSALAKNLAEVVTEVLPLLNDIVIAIMGNFGEMTGFVASIARNLGDRILDVASELGPVLALITAYGAGFFDMALLAVTYVAMAINYISGAVDVVTGLINSFSGLSVESRTVMYYLGGLIGVMNVLSRVATFLSGLKMSLAAAAIILSKSYTILTASTVTLSAATKALALYSTLALASLMGIYYGIQRLRNINIGDDGWLGDIATAVIIIGASLIPFVYMAIGAVSSFISVLSLLGAKIAVIKSSLIFKSLVTIFGMLGALIKGLIVKGLIAVAGIVAGISATTAAIVATIVGIVVLIADLTYYLKTGDSFLVNWEKRLRQMAEYAERIRDALPGKDSRAVSGPGGNNVDDLAARGARFEPDSGGSNNSEPEVQTAGIDAGPSAQDMADSFSAMINVDASRSERELSKMIRREIDSAFNDFMKRDL